MSDAWKIQICENRLHLAPFDTLLYGRPVCHSFLRLSDASGVTRQEIHAGGYIEAKNTYLLPMNAKDYGAIVRHGLKEKAFPHAVVRVRGYEESISPAARHNILLEDSEAVVLARWNAALMRGDELNKLNIPYRLFSQNCNTIADDLANAMGVRLLATDLLAVGTKRQPLETPFAEATTAHRFFRQLELAPEEQLAQTSQLAAALRFNILALRPRSPAMQPEHEAAYSGLAATVIVSSPETPPATRRANGVHPQ